MDKGIGGQADNLGMGWTPNSPPNRDYQAIGHLLKKLVFWNFSNRVKVASYLLSKIIFLFWKYKSFLFVKKLNFRFYLEIERLVPNYNCMPICIAMNKQSRFKFQHSEQYKNISCLAQNINHWPSSTTLVV